MPIEEVKAFKSSDGRIWGTMDEATDAQITLDFRDWYGGGRSTTLYSEHGHVAADELLEWLLENREYLIDFLNTTE